MGLPFKTANHLKGRYLMQKSFLQSNTGRMCSSAMCLALCLVLPFLTGQIPHIGSALCPMHIPVLLAGFICGPWWAMVTGIMAPILRHFLFTMPPLVTAIAMSFELGTYGAICGLMQIRTPKNTRGTYAALIIAMITGRIVWGIAMVLITGVTGSSFSWALFLAGAFTNAVPGIILQLILIPVLISSLRKANYLE